jgi:hypothetical protein
MTDECKCHVAGCSKQARWQIGFRIWPAAVVHRTPNNGIEGISGTCVCDEHAVRDPDKFFTPAGKEKIAISFLQGGKGMPDFSTAQIIHTALVDDDPITKEEAARLGGVMSAT